MTLPRLGAPWAALLLTFVVACRPAPVTSTAEEPHAEATPHADASDWCAGHGLPESKCTVCNPHLTEGFKAAGDWCEEHGYQNGRAPCRERV